MTSRLAPPATAMPDPMKPTEPPAPPSLVHGVAHAPRLDEGRVVVVGNFDGVHRGHAKLLALAGEIAAAAKAPRPHVTALTFDPHPAVHFGRPAPALLTRIERRAELLARHGADAVVVQPFDADFAALTADEFVREILVDRLGARGLVVGHDFRFGKGRAGDLATLARAGERFGFVVRELDALADGRDLFSSTRARAAIVVGDLDDASAVLGRPHAIEGVVVHGAQRGRTIGFPTANVGVRPTLGGDPRPTVEAHLFDLDPRDHDLYGAQLRVHFVARLRDEQKFSSFDALKLQIARDADQARAALVTRTPRDAAAWC